MKVADQTGRPVYAMGFVYNGSTYDRLRRAQPGTVFAYDDETRLWVECKLVPVEGGETIDPLADLKKEE